MRHRVAKLDAAFFGWYEHLIFGRVAYLRARVVAFIEPDDSACGSGDPAGALASLERIRATGPCMLLPGHRKP